MRAMRTPLVLLATVGALGALAAPAVAANRTVLVGDNWFVRDTRARPTVTVDRNDRVRWVWRDTSSSHNVVVTRGPVRFRSPTRSSGSYPRSMGRRMTTRGTYTLVCTIHGASDQSMTLRVR